ncbi:uncharacterized protein LOC114461132 [Gouania willdenowi]|uniref:uncharacterized protein LOC114461132 n=1 Tax=Gouania willdenowi TaxID=441366 RepID=UPI001054D293|nr:uncharacterized protein LOC114461132 [Gouania willdenowi]
MTVPTLEAEQALLASQASAAVPGSSAAPSPQATAFVPPIPPVIPLLPVTQSHVASSSASAAPSPAVTALLPHSTQTVSPAEQSTSAPSTDPSPHSSSCHGSVGPDNIEGYGAVQDLADYLAGLRDHRLALTQEECSQVIALWQELGEYDKKKNCLPSSTPDQPEQGTIPGYEEDCGSRCGEHQKVLQAVQGTGAGYFKAGSSSFTGPNGSSIKTSTCPAERTNFYIWLFSSASSFCAATEHCWAGTT